MAALAAMAMGGGASRKSPAEKLVELANAGGGLDNIAVVVVDPYETEELNPLPDDTELQDTESEAGELFPDNTAGEEIPEQKVPAEFDSEGDITAEDSAEDENELQAQPETGRN